MNTPQANGLVDEAVALFSSGKFAESSELLLSMFFAAPQSRGLVDLLLDSLFAQRRFEDGIRIATRYLVLEPSNHKIRLTLVRFYVALGDWESALAAYEHRLHVFPNLMPVGMSPEIARKTRWYGGKLPKHLILFGEQGLGDVVLFARFIPGITARGVNTTLVAQPQLFTLLSTMRHAPQFRSKDDTLQLPSGTRWAHLMSLPFLMNWTPKDAGTTPPYLFAQQERVDRWRAVLKDSGFKIGISWRGAPNRSSAQFVPLPMFAPLAKIDGVRLVSLQKDGETDLQSISFPVERLDHLDEEGAFLDTAAVMECVDLVVTVDTAIAHVAGALAKPVYIMLHGAWPDWRWMDPGTEQTLWYPTAKLFRQPKANEWAAVVDQIVHEARALTRV